MSTSVDMLEVLLKRILEEVSLELKEEHIVKIPKKGKLDECKHYRGISLLVTAGNVLNGVILERCKEGLDSKLREEQAGFR